MRAVEYGDVNDHDGSSRRRFLLSAGSAVGLTATSGCLGRRDPFGSDVPADPPTSEAERRSTFPLATYENADGRAVVTMPVNVRVDLRGSDRDVEDVRDVFRFDVRWSPIVRALDRYWPFHDSPVQYTWDSDVLRWLPSLASYRYPFFLRMFRGELGYHVYLWAVRVDGELVGVAVQAHRDVGSVLDHAGSAYDAAAWAAASTFERAGWRIEQGAFAYDVSREQAERWGPTGDLVVQPPGGDA